MLVASENFEAKNNHSVLSKRIEGQRKTYTVSGLEMRYVQLRLWVHIMFLIVKKTKSINKFLYAFNYLRATRKVTMGNVRLRKYIKLGRQYSWSIYTPPWPSDELDKGFNLELDYLFEEKNPINPLHFVFLSITKQCPLNCEHCYEWDIMKAEEKLQLDDLKRIIYKFQQKNISSIFLTGGEPLCRYDDLLELVKFGAKKSKIWVVTSGYSLTPRKAQELKDAGLFGVLISIDHYKEAEHNRFRGNTNSFKKAVEAVSNANEVGLTTAISICVTKSFISKDNLERYMQFAKSLGVAYVQFFEPRSEGKYKNKDVTLTTDQLNTLRTFYRNFNNSIHNNQYPLIIYPGYHQKKQGCHGAGKWYLYIDSNGNIQACPFCKNKMGSALQENLNYSLGTCKQYVLSMN